METPLIRVELNDNGSKGYLGATHSLKHRVTFWDMFLGHYKHLSQDSRTSFLV